MYKEVITKTVLLGTGFVLMAGSFESVQAQYRRDNRDTTVVRRETTVVVKRDHRRSPDRRYNDRGYRDNYRDNYRRPRRPKPKVHHHHHHKDYKKPSNLSVGLAVGAAALATAAVLTCAPEVVDANVKVTERILLDVASMEDFADEATFQAEVQKIVSTPVDAKTKVGMLFVNLGINAENYEDVFAFIGAREVPIKAVEALVANLDMDRQNAEVLAAKLQQGLLGSLNR